MKKPQYAIDQERESAEMHARLAIVAGVTPAQAAAVMKTFFATEYKGVSEPTFDPDAEDNTLYVLDQWHQGYSISADENGNMTTCPCGG